MKRNYIICIGFPKWQGNYAKSTVMLMRALSTYYDILYVDYQHTLKDVILGVFGRRDIPVLRTLGLKCRLFKDEKADNVWILTPPCVLPVNWINNFNIFKWFLRLNTGIVRRSIAWAMKRLLIDRPVVVNAFNPFYGIYNIGKLEESCHIYYCYDEIGEAKWMKKHGVRLEQEFAAEVDAVVVSSSSLREKMTRINQSSYLIANGVDFDLFHQQLSNLGSKGISVIGYTGSIDERLDFEFIEHLAGSLPSTRFVFVGRITDRNLIKNLMQYPNVNFVDPVDYYQLPEVLKQFDLCLIPFRKNGFTRNIYPMKLNEYLAAGKLVIMTDFAHLPEFNNIVKVCKNSDEALRSIQSLNKDKAEVQAKIKEGVKLAKEASWANRARDFHSVIEKCRR